MSNTDTTILFINHWGKNLGGAEHSLLDIIAEACRWGRIHVLCSEQGQLLDRARQRGAHTHVIPCPGDLHQLNRDLSLSGLLKRIPTLCSFIGFCIQATLVTKRINPTIIHGNVPKSHSTLLFISLFHKKHRALYHIREIFPDNRFLLFMYRCAARMKSSHFIAISRAVQRALPKALQCKTTLIYNGVPVYAQAKKHRQKKSIHFLYVGRIVPWKGCDLLVEMFSEFLQVTGHQEAHFTIMGGTFYWDPGYRDNLLALIHRLHLEKQVSLLPYTENPETYYEDSDIFCTAAQQEPFGRTIAEAMVKGLPVISFDSGGPSELIIHGKTGYLIKSGNRGDYIQAMGKLTRDWELRDRLGSQGRQRVLHKFNKNNQLPKLMDCILAREATGESSD